MHHLTDSEEFKAISVHLLDRARECLGVGGLETGKPFHRDNLDSGLERGAVRLQP